MLNKDEHILIVDDYRTMLHIMTNLFKQLGYENVDTETNVTDALLKLGKKKYGLVMAERRMEPRHALDLLQTMREHDKTKDIPFMVLTGQTFGPNELTGFMRQGKVSYIVKPFNADTLKRKVNRLFEDIEHG